MLEMSKPMLSLNVGSKKENYFIFDMITYGIYYSNRITVLLGNMFSRYVFKNMLFKLKCKRKLTKF